MKRDTFTLPLAFPGELIIDNFAGGGGTSEGLEAAFGRPVDIAINHDPEALAMHALNHPYTHHLCESVWDVKPNVVTKNQPVGLVWLSPDCKHFSKAKGSTPVEKQIRGLAWVGMRWLALTKPRVMMLENVEEFQDWGPLLIDADGNARPDPAKKGKTFESFVRQIRAHGYAVEWREMRACDNGAPTIRKRLFLQARRDGIPIVWPDQTHGNPVSAAVVAGKLLPWRTAAECIDFSTPAASIFDRKRPLVVNTQRRVAKGLWKHVLTSASPYIVSRSSEPMLTPFISEHANASNQRNMAIDEPLRTQCAEVKGGHFSMVAPTLVPMRGTSEAHLGGHDIEAPLSTISAGGTHHALVAGHITKFNTGAIGSGLDEPLATITAGGTPKRPSTGITQGLVGAHLVTIGYGERKGQAARAQNLVAPLGAIVTANKHAIVSAYLEQANGGFYEGDGRAVTVPVSTITASGSNQRLVTAYYVKYYSSGGQDGALNNPMHTVPTKGRMGLVECLQVPADSLAPEHRARARQCAELLREHLPEHFPEAADMVLVWLEGQYWVLVDITLRMLKPPELFQAQGFEKTYIIHEIPDPKLLFVNGKQVAGDPRLLPRIPLTATAQVRMCGNSVSPKQSEALARTSFRHEARIHHQAPSRRAYSQFQNASKELACLQ